MANRSSKHSRKANGWLSALIVILIIACAGVGLVGYYSEGFQSWERFQKVETESALKFEIQNSAFIMLSTDVTDASENLDQTYIERKLTATVLPENAVNKEVEWSIYWEDGSNDPDISIYLELISNENTAVIRCHKSFSKTAVVQVTTTEGNFTAKCYVSYVGIASSFHINTSAVMKNSYTGIDNAFDVDEDTEYKIPLEITNSLGVVSPNFEISTSSHGYYYAYFAFTDSEDILPEYKDNMYDLYPMEGHPIYAQFFDKPIIVEENGEWFLKLKSNKFYSYETKDFYFDGDLGKYVCEWNKFKESHSDLYDDAAYFQVTITDTVSGLSDSFYIFFAIPVNGVSIDNTKIVF